MSKANKQLPKIPIRTRRASLYFHPMEGSGPLSISWSSAPKGAAVEAKGGNGVGFFSPDGGLLSVIFDDVSAAEDIQILEFKQHRVEISVKDEVVKHKVTSLIGPKIMRGPRKPTRSSLKPRRSKAKY